ncbi:MAG: TraB/GumN family protein [Paludibacteraceae bacterium]|nr:TraB/GumN family protein [Paludibacteraceae bacterium]
MLYKVSGNGASAKSYILATNRLTDIVFLDSIPNLFKCYSACNKVVTEFALQDYEALAALRQAALLPDSVRLKNFYSEDEYNEIDEALRVTLNMGLDKLGRMKPQYLTEMYRMELLRKWVDYDDNRSSSHFFEAVAVEQNKPIYGLDDLGETMYMTFDREPFHWQCNELLNIIRYPELEVRQEKTLRDLYRMGRLLDISYQVSGPDNKSSISFSDYQIYVRRNKQWVKRLSPYLRDGKAFVVLDAIYLGGEGGLIAQLQAAGWKVRPVNKR